MTLASLGAIQEKDDAALGPLRPGDYGVVTEDDKSTKPFKVRLGPARTYVRDVFFYPGHQPPPFACCATGARSCVKWETDIKVYGAACQDIGQAHDFCAGSCVQVQAAGSSSEWWYRRGALELAINGLGAPVKRGGGEGGGGDTGAAPSSLWYCGRRMGQCR